MIGSKLKKFAAEMGFTVKNGIAYGIYKDYLLTLKDVNGMPSVTFAVYFTDENIMGNIHLLLDNEDIKKSYAIYLHEISVTMIHIVFLNKLKAIEYIKSFIDMLCEKLSASAVKGAAYCNCCGLETDLTAAHPVMINSNAFLMHSGCIDKIAETQKADYQEIKTMGSVLTGTIGAAIGGIIGAIPWAVVYYFGWFVGWLGLLIGLAAKKGYELFKGKETKAKAVVIIIVAALAVVFAELVTCIVSLSSEISAGNLNYSIIDTIRLLFTALGEDPELQRMFLIDILMGWLFAGLGLYSMIRSIFHSTKSTNGVPYRLDDSSK